jgi:uncharacterized protein (DUF486 family)
MLVAIIHVAFFVGNNVFHDPSWYVTLYVTTSAVYTKLITFPVQSNVIVSFHGVTYHDTNGALSVMLVAIIHVAFFVGNNVFHDPSWYVTLYVTTSALHFAVNVIFSADIFDPEVYSTPDKYHPENVYHSLVVTALSNHDITSL